MQLVNYTPFPAITWEVLAPDGREQGVLLVRGCFELIAGNTGPHLDLHPAAEQGEWFGEDRFFGPPGQSAVRYESDFVPSKPRTDLILNAVTYSPSNSPQPRWRCGVGVASRAGKALFHKRLQVTGERFWHRSFWRWRLSDPKVCTQVPIRYELAFGGSLQAPAKPDGTPGPWIACCEQNPIGVGLLPDKQPTDMVRAPRIEDPRRPITDPRAIYPPQGFGCIHRAWQPRLALAGTFDSTWLANKHPLLPDDFKDAHNNGAHLDLIGAGLTGGHLKGNETLRLEHLLPDQPICHLRLPGYRLLVRLRLPTDVTVYQRLNLDTILVDIDAPDQAQWRVYLSWRVRYPLDPAPDTIEAMLIKSDRPKDTRDGG